MATPLSDNDDDHAWGCDMRKSAEELTRMACRVPKRLVVWLDSLNPGNRTHALVQILEAAYVHSTCATDNPNPVKTGAEKNFERVEIRIRNVVEEGDVAEARKVISEVPSGLSKPLDKWRRILSEPKGQQEGVASGGCMKPNLAWLRGNSMQYRGQWVALKDGSLLGNNQSRLTLRSDLKESNQLKGAMFFRIEE
jgi:hypothetical protein